MTTTPRGIAKSLDPSRYAAFLSPDDQVAVTRNTRGNLNPGFAQTMTVSQARAFRAWDTVSGTMSASVTEVIPHTFTRQRITSSLDVKVLRYHNTPCTG